MRWLPREEHLELAVVLMLEGRNDHRHRSEEMIESGECEGVFVVDSSKVGVIAIIEMYEAIPTWFRPDGELSEERVAYLYGEYAVRIAGIGARLTVKQSGARAVAALLTPRWLTPRWMPKLSPRR